MNMTEEEYQSIAERFFGIMLEKGIFQPTITLPKGRVPNDLVGYESGKHIYTKKQWIRELASTFREFEEREKASIKAEREAIKNAKKLKELMER